MTQKFVFKKPNFGPPPKGYIAGLGRGATGFITRSDLGPAQIPNNSKISQNEGQDEAALNDNKFDQWQGYKGALFTKNIVDEEDRQAEQAYDYCQRKMDQRRAKQREQTLKKQMQKYKSQNVPINQKFKDLKRQLSKISMQQWANIPQSHDSSIKKSTRQKYVPTPDSLLTSFLISQNSSSIQPQSNQDYRQAKQTLLKSKLNQVQQKQSSIDRAGYLTQLNVGKLDQNMIGDIGRARLLLRSATMANPKNQDVWISAARVEQLDGKLNQARDILKQAVLKCPLSQDIWMEYSRLEKFDNAKNVIIQGLKNIPASEKLWIYAAKLQSSDKQMKAKILRKGLQNNPTSVKLWKQLIQTQDLQQAKKLLYKAVQFIPKQIQLWLALCKIQTYQNAKKILNQARKANPLSQAIWINAAKLEETKYLTDGQENTLIMRNKNVEKIQSILIKARDVLRKNGKNVSRDQWLDEAFYCQKSQNLLTCQALTKMSFNYGLNQQQILNTLLKDAKLFEQQRQSVYLVRYLYKHGLILLKDKLLFQKYIFFQQRVQKRRQQQLIEKGKQQQVLKDIFDNADNSKVQSQLVSALHLGTSLFPNQSKFWLMSIQNYISKQDYVQAQLIIKSACSSVVPQICQQIKLQRVKLLKKQSKLIQAKCQLELLTKQYPQGKSKIQWVGLEYQMGNYQKAWELTQQFYKDLHVEELWILAFRILNKLNRNNQTKTLIEKALTIFPNSIKLWKMWIDFEITNNNVGRARSIMDKALLKNPKDQQLYLKGFDIEYYHGSPKDASFFLAKAMKACPKSGQLWSKALQMQGISSRKKKANIALQTCGTSCASLNCSIAKIFWKQNKLQKSKKWISSSLQLQRKNGDIWCLYLLFLKQNYSMEYNFVYDEFIKNQITQGRIWKQILQKQQNKTKEQIYNTVIKLIDQQMLRIQ